MSMTAAKLLGIGVSLGRVGWCDESTQAEHDAAERSRIVAALASAAAGRVVPVAEIREWVESLGTDQVLPLPRARRWADRLTPGEAPSMADEAVQSLGDIDWWYGQPGNGGAEAGLRRVRAILAAIERLAAAPDRGVPGPVAGTREVTCQRHRIVYTVPREAGAHPVVLDVLGPGQQ